LLFHDGFAGKLTEFRLRRRLFPETFTCDSSHPNKQVFAAAFIIPFWTDEIRALVAMRRKLHRQK
tara:strand:+ start:17876 stop:18070 length:195 start_codon:yes stop_codon:yes gene_type:complete